MIDTRRMFLIVVGVLTLAGCTGGPVTFEVPGSVPSTTGSPSSTDLTSPALVPAPDTRAPSAPVVIPPYDDDAFKYWSDLDGDRCNTRNEMLARDAIEFHDNDGDGCAERGEFVAILDPYTERAISPRGEIDIDHVVSRKDAWESGAWAWDDDLREVFANDESNLLSVEDNVNQSKGERGPDEWRPEARSGWCVYATVYRDVKITYGLVVTPAEQTGLDELLATC